MSDFYWVPDQGPTEDVKTDVNETRFGEGYSQRVPNGINSVRQMWDLDFTQRSIAEIMEIRAFLKDKKGASSFTWTNPYGEVIKVTARSWKTNVNWDGDCSASVSFAEEFDI